MGPGCAPRCGARWGEQPWPVAQGMWLCRRCGMWHTWGGGAWPQGAAHPLCLLPMQHPVTMHHVPRAMPPVCPAPHPRAMPYTAGQQPEGAPRTVATPRAMPCSHVPPSPHMAVQHAPSPPVPCTTLRGHCPCHTGTASRHCPHCSHFLCYAPWLRTPAPRASLHQAPPTHPAPLPAATACTTPCSCALPNDFGATIKLITKCQVFSTKIKGH